MLTVENVLYIRLILLWTRAGCGVLRKLVAKRLQKQSLSLENFLHNNKESIINAKYLCNKQLKLMFPHSSDPPDILKWDISVLCYLILDFLEPKNSTVHNAVTKIRDMRNEIIGHPGPSIEVDIYSKKWAELNYVIVYLSSSFTETEKTEINELIQSVADANLNMTTDLSEIHEHNPSKDSLEHIGRQVKRIADTMQNYQQVTEKDHALQQDARNFPDEFGNDPYYLQLYIDAISKGEEKDRVIRLNVVGNFAQGKTTLIKRLTHKTIEGVECTNSVEINHCKYEFTQDKLNFFTKEHTENEDDVTRRIARVAQHSVKLKEKQEKRNHLYDYPSQTEVHFSIDLSVQELKRNLDNGGKTDERNKQQFEVKTEESYELTETVDRNLDRSNLKSELICEESLYVSKFDHKKFALQLENCQHIEIHHNDLEIWDFGGQFSFYATHSLFHSRRAVYLLVFDLSIPLCDIVKDSEFPNSNDEKTMEEYAKFWLNSIHAYVGSEDGKEPPVILVGTHKDKLEGDEVAKKDYVYKYFVQIKKLFKDKHIKCHIQPTYFAVDNTDVKDHDIIKLRKEVIQQGEKLGNESIPAKWIPLEKALKMNRHTKIMSFENVMNIDSRNEFPLKEVEQVRLFLRYHHFKGTLLFFDEEPISAYIVLDPQYLIDAFKCIITSKRFSDQDLWERLTEEALLENDLIDSLWNKENGFSEHKKVLLMFLEKHLIISEVSVFDEDSQKLHGSGKYLVPSLLPSNCSEAHLIAFLEGRQQTSVRFVMSFYRSGVVQLVFYRLLAALIGKWTIVQIPTPEQNTLIYENKGVFRLDKNHAGIVEYTDHEIDLRVLSLLPSCKVDSKCADELRRFSESIVKNEFMKFRNSMTQQDKPYKTCFKCNNKIHGLGGGINSEALEDIRDKHKIPCPDLTSHEIEPAQILSEWFLKDKIDMSFPERQLNGKEVSEIAKAIGHNWRLLGVELGLTNAKLDHIEEDNKTSIMRRYAMLSEWKRQRNDTATIKALIHAMETETHVCIEWDAIRNFVDKIKSN